ncbi:MULTISPECIES: TipC family immunity protein [unclassified Streptococcus]|jgi:fructoselysine 6-phosphate deglycase|uniref:TipC family immunity protein n=1 Tax=unclassified Streptococcus TaxID=2608887 RepID=UPI0020C83558|nr:MULTISPECIES: TipC family immunity protein [unclassified Streptococcus]MCP9036814.1 TipC family immunity protein [Streptococcus sp. CF8_Ac1-9]MCP9044136.1 TipC family immunity protein [Streptococcus sp. CF8_Ac1-11]
MKKHLKKFLWLSPFLLVALYWLGIYLSLKNPMEEINYAENGGWMRYVMFKPFTETIGNDGIWKEDEDFQTYPYSKGIIGGNEELSVLMFRETPDWTYMYDLELQKGVTLGFMFKYNSSKKLFFQKEVYLSKEDTTYEGQKLLDQLAAYGKDRTWLKKQSKKFAEQYILGTWFKNGSSRYSLKNLGDMKIEYNKLIEE